MPWLYSKKNGVILKQRIVIFLLLLTTSRNFAQNASISGFVAGVQNGESLIGANVYFKEISEGASTNTSGYYVIPDIPPGNYTIICSYIGYAEYRKRIRLRPKENLRLNITLSPLLIETESINIVADSVRTSIKLFDKAISKINLSPAEIKQMPAVAEADLLRTLQSLPGILSISDYSSEIYVRGGTSDQNLFLIDGADVYNPEHAFGLFSTFNTDAIKNAEISKGGFGAEYGGRLSSVLNITNLDGNRKSFEGMAEISLLSAKTTLQMPLGNFGSISGSFRRTYLAETAKLFVKKIPEYHFYDANIKAFFDLGISNKLTFSFYNSDDNLNYEFNSGNEDSPTLGYNWGNISAGMRWTHIFSPRFFSNFWINFSNFSSKFSVMDIDETNTVKDITGKGQFEYALAKSIGAQFGFEYKHLNINFSQESSNAIVDMGSPQDYIALYLSARWHPGKRWVIEPGLRFNSFKSSKNFQDWAPRFAVKYRLNETINLKASSGIYYQYLQKIPRPFFADIWTASDNNYDRSRSRHFIAGFQKEIADNLALEIEGYYKDYNNLYSLNNYYVDFKPQKYDKEGKPIYTSTCGLFNRGDGYSYGVEFILRKNYGSLSGWLAYSLSRTDYLIDNINHNRYFEPRHDRTHVINFVFNIDIKNALRELSGKPYRIDKTRWKLGANFVYSSGQPITLTSSTYYAGSTPDQPYEQLFLYPTSINNFRLPPYIRLDLSLRYEIQHIKWKMSPYLQIFNIGNRENVWFIQYENEVKNNRINQTVTTTDMFPILPTIGIRFNF
jgi:hypothetical protein